MKLIHEQRQCRETVKYLYSWFPFPNLTGCTAPVRPRGHEVTSDIAPFFSPPFFPPNLSLILALITLTWQCCSDPCFIIEVCQNVFFEVLRFCFAWSDRYHLTIEKIWKINNAHHCPTPNNRRWEYAFQIWWRLEKLYFCIIINCRPPHCCSYKRLGCYRLPEVRQANPQTLMDDGETYFICFIC